LDKKGGKFLTFYREGEPFEKCIAKKICPRIGHCIP